MFSYLLYSLYMSLCKTDISLRWTLHAGPKDVLYRDGWDCKRCEAKWSCSIETLGSWSNSKGDGYENVTWKVNSRCFKVYRTYSISFSSSNVGKLFWNWVLEGLNQSSGKEKESLCLVSTSAKKRENWEVWRYSRAVTAKKCTKKRDARAKLFFANLNLLLFCRSCCRPRRRC